MATEPANPQSGATGHIKLAYRIIGPKRYIHHRAWRAWRKSADGHEGELKLLSSIVPRDRMAVDVGANRGNYTFFLSRLAARTVAYEPAPPMARFVREARLKNVDVREAGVSDSPGKLLYCVPLNEKGKPQYNIGYLGDGLPAGKKGIEVPVKIVRLDDEKLDNVGFMKIDVEGHEYEVIQGARELLTRSRPNLLVEILYERGNRAGVAQNRTVRLLDELGYEPYVYARGALRPLSDAPLSQDVINYIFLPRSTAMETSK
ncbi:MAG: FkbM family methyltransferase [Alphaproteobacteria bacterium]|nr:FkbM family methyltransferase [Alphaproteobacteria bacterium]